MERRKVQKTGTSTFTVSLPKAWALKNEITPGDEVVLQEGQDGSLSITTKPDTRVSRKKEIVADGLSEGELITKLIGSYISGYDTILIKGTKLSSIRDDVLTQSERLIGFEMIEEDDNKILIQNFFSPENLSITREIRRAFNISMLMQKSLNELLEKKDSELFDRMQKNENEVDKLYFLVRRQLGKALASSALIRSLNLSTHTCLEYSLLMREIENNTDCIMKVAKYVMQMRANDLQALGKTLIQLNKEVIDLYSSAMEAIFTNDVGLANKTIERHKLIKEKRDAGKLLHGNGNAVSTSAEQIVECLLDVVDGAVDIAEIVINISA